MAITISEQLFKDVRDYLVAQPETDQKAEELFDRLQEVEIERTYEELKAEKQLPTPKEGYWVY